MHSLTRLATSLLTLALFFLTPYASSFPAGAPPPQKLRDCTGLITPSLSPGFDWSSPEALSLAQCLMATEPNPSTCVFYTRGSRNHAIRFAAEHSKTTIYDVYPPTYFDITAEPARTWLQNEQLWSLFRVTSKAYAMSCSGHATLVIPEQQEPCPSSIWVTDEYDAIKNRLTRIELPIWRASLVTDQASGLVSWVVGKLLATGWINKDGQMERRGVVQDSQVVVSNVFGDRALEQVVRQKLEWAERLGGERTWSNNGPEVDLWAMSSIDKCAY